MEREGQQHQNIQKHTNTKLCVMNDLEMVEREGGRANSGGRKQLTEEEVGCMCIEVICNCVEVGLVHKWIDRVYWKCIDWLCLLACTAQYLAVDLPGRGRGATFAFSVHSQIFHSRLQVDNGRRGNRLTACGHAPSRAKCSLEIASFNLWTCISCDTEGMLEWWK